MQTPRRPLNRPSGPNGPPQLRPTQLELGGVVFVVNLVCPCPWGFQVRRIDTAKDIAENLAKSPNVM